MKSLHLRLLNCLGLLIGSVISPLLVASTNYTYSGTGSDVNLSFTLNAPSANIPAGTDVTESVTSFVMSYPLPVADGAGFPVGPGSSFTLTTLQIGTDASGNVTSWNIIGSELASFPAFPGENPNDFYCNYAVTFSASGSPGLLSTDHDAGFCPAADAASANGSWAASALPVRLQSFDVD
jgi:hypothetical protein